jgi:predicted Zn-dependent protease
MLSAHAQGENDPLWSKPTYEKKLYAVGQALLKANHITEKITFHVNYRQPDEENNVNAYALEQSGEITVEDGLLSYIENDDELAAILGHELAHITHRHTSQQQTEKTVQAILIRTPLTVLGALAGPPGIAFGQRLARNISHTMTNPESRRMEMDADQQGLDYMVNAGYDPHAFISILNKILADGTEKVFWRDHPSGTERIQALESLIVTKYSPTDPTPSLSHQNDQALLGRLEQQTSLRP